MGLGQLLWACVPFRTVMVSGALVFPSLPPKTLPFSHWLQNPLENYSQWLDLLTEPDRSPLLRNWICFPGLFFWKHIFFPKVSWIISFRSWFHADVSGQGLEAGRWYCVSVGCLRGECFKRHAFTSSASASNFLVNCLPRGYCHLVAQPFPRWPCFLRIVGSITHSVFKTGHFRNTDLF